MKPNRKAEFTPRTAPSPARETTLGSASSRLAMALLENPVAQAVLNALGGHAVVLGPGRRLLASSTDALPALGVETPHPLQARFPLPEELDLAARGFRLDPVPVLVGGVDWEVCVFRDVRDQIRETELARDFLKNLLTLASQVEAAGAGEAAGARLLELSGQLQREIRAQWRIQSGQEWTEATPPELLAEGAPRPALVPREEQALVLVVDDSPMVVKLLEFILTREGHRVLTADRGAQVLDLAAEAQPDLILLDAVMPDLDGFQVCGQLKGEPRTRELPVLFVTALRGEADEVAALAAGAVDFIPKPINPAIVAARVRTHLELKRSKDRLRALTYLDGLTGIANRRQFDQCLEQEWQRTGRSGRPLSLVMGDVDCFKSYNDHFGHAAGDECLRQLAAVFRSALRRPGDLAARYGGEEFICILPDTDEAGARLVAEQIQAQLAALALPHPYSEAAPLVTVSLGLATAWPSPSAGPASLLAAADRNMYRAKRLGRNGVFQDPA